MERIIKILKNNCKVIFDKGTFDNWCIYIVDENGSRYAPTDIEYFSELKQLATTNSFEKVYSDFVMIYEKTTDKISAEVLELINSIAITYPAIFSNTIEQWFTVLYAGMVAEENKEKAILKKRIKRLGMHQLLVDNASPSEAAHFSRGKNWRELDSIMKLKGF